MSCVCFLLLAKLFSALKIEQNQSEVMSAKFMVSHEIG